MMSRRAGQRVSTRSRAAPGSSAQHSVPARDAYDGESRRPRAEARLCSPTRAAIPPDELLRTTTADEGESNGVHARLSILVVRRDTFARLGSGRLRPVGSGPLVLWR